MVGERQHGGCNQWKGFGRAICGDQHKRRGQRCQDHFEKREGHTWVAVAVADGHGSPRCRWSHLGAQFAVEAALEALENFAGKSDTPPDAVARNIITLWRHKVARHWKSQWAGGAASEPAADEPASPASGPDAASLPTALSPTGEQPPSAPEETDFLSYGTTLLAAAVCQEQIILLQVGDGDILRVCQDASVERVAFPGSPRPICRGVETRSLAQCVNPEDVDIRKEPVARDLAMLMLATDGYANSFENEEAFLKVGTDLLRELEKRGLKWVEGNLENWLTNVSQAGSGDDIAVGVLIRSELLPKDTASPHISNETGNPAAPGEAYGQ